MSSLPLSTTGAKGSSLCVTAGASAAGSVTEASTTGSLIEVSTVGSGIEASTIGSVTGSSTTGFSYGSFCNRFSSVDFTSASVTRGSSTGGSVRVGSSATGSNATERAKHKKVWLKQKKHQNNPPLYILRLLPLSTGSEDGLGIDSRGAASKAGLWIDNWLNEKHP